MARECQQNDRTLANGLAVPVVEVFVDVLEVVRHLVGHHRHQRDDQPCPLYLHAISLIALTLECIIIETKETINPVYSTYIPSLQLRCGRINSSVTLSVIIGTKEMINPVHSTYMPSLWLRCD